MNAHSRFLFTGISKARVAVSAKTSCFHNYPPPQLRMYVYVCVLYIVYERLKDRKKERHPPHSCLLFQTVVPIFSFFVNQAGGRFSSAVVTFFFRQGDLGEHNALQCWRHPCGREVTEVSLEVSSLPSLNLNVNDILQTLSPRIESD